MTGPRGSDLTSIRNIGPAMAHSLQAAGIYSAEELRTLGADEAYARLLANGNKPHFIAYYALHMALQGRPWNDCKGSEKDALRVTFDTLVSGHFDQPRSDLDRFLDQIGVVQK